LARTFSELGKLGWRPRRSIILASWDAEEYSLVGSTEWVEENIDWIRANVIGYVNVDVAVGGDVFVPSASPVFKDLLYKVAKQVPYPGSNETLYDAWLQNSLGDAAQDALARNKDPSVTTLGSGSDYAAFMAHAGISSIDVGFSGNMGTYHSNYDSLARMAAFIDPGMKLHQAITRVWGLLAISLADDPVLAFNAVSYAKDLNRYIRALRRHISTQAISPLKGQEASDSVNFSEVASAKKLRHLRAAQRQLLVSARILERDKKHLRSVYAAEDQDWRRFRQYEKHAAELVYEAAWFLRET
ncbi:Vacuolar protein sorting-associated protein 70, partial [Coemansia sp. RSA 2559]